MSLEGKTVCFTGTLDSQTRGQATAAAKRAGAKVSKTITNAVDIVICAAGSGAKKEQAEKKGCDIWTEEEFLAALGGEEKEEEEEEEPQKKPAAKKKAPAKRGKKKQEEEEEEEEEEDAMEEDEPAAGGGSIEGKCLCFTGTLQNQTRAQATAAAKEAGATVAKSITKNVDIVVAAQGAGAKLEEAKKKGCEVWTEEQFEAAVGGEEEEEGEEEAEEDEAEDKMEEEEAGGLEGKCICFTGTLQSQTRAQATAAAKKAGATVAKSITKNVDIVVAGPGAGAKLEDAKNKGCEVWTEKQFQAAVGGEAEEETETPSKKKRATVAAASPPPAKKAKSASSPKPAATPAKKPKGPAPATPAVPGSKTRKVMSAIEGGNDVYSVVEDYDVKLMLSDQVNMNSNKFYKLQLLQKNADDNYYVATNWGRLGEPGRCQLKGPHSDHDKAVKEFSKVFRSKTKNDWGAQPFVRYGDKYQLVETTIEEDDDDDGTGQALGRLTESQIHKGQAVLKDIRAVLEEDDSKKRTTSKRAQELGNLSNDFYSLIPTASGRQRPPKLDNIEIVTEKEGLLEFWLRMGFEEVSPQGAEGSPIEGVLDLPVPSTLKAAASSISDNGSINSSQQRGKTLSAKKAGSPVTDMGPELYAAILLYTGNSIYRELNRCLRLEWKSAKKYWNYLRLYFAAMDCMPQKKVTLWRGIAADLYDEYEPGKIITWWTVSSCTSSKQVAQNFMSQLGGKATLLTLHTLKACDISSLSFYPHEQESLLSPGTKLKVLSRKRNGKVAEIEVEEVVDDEEEEDKKMPAVEKKDDNDKKDDSE